MLSLVLMGAHQVKAEEKCGSNYRGVSSKVILRTYAKQLKKQGFQTSFREDAKSKIPHLVAKLEIKGSPYVSSVDYKLTELPKNSFNICGTSFFVNEPPTSRPDEKAAYLQTFDEKLKKATSKADKDLQKMP